MKSKIAEALKLKYPPLAVFYAQRPPDETMELNFHCAMSFMAQAAKGHTVTITPDNCECNGGHLGLGFKQFANANFPGGRDCFLHFLSTGLENWEPGKAILNKMAEGGVPKMTLTIFSEGEGYKKSPEHVAQWVDGIPKYEAEAKYLILKPLENLSAGETPKSIIFLADAEQLSALVVLANFARPGADNVRIPFGSGCSSIALYPFYESVQPNPRAVIGLTDISARLYIQKSLGRDLLSFSVPFSMFEEMDSNVPESFLMRHTWKTLRRE